MTLPVSSSPPAVSVSQSREHSERTSGAEDITRSPTLVHTPLWPHLSRSSAADDTVPRRPSASPKTGAERTFELLSFDTIDERPAAEESYDLLDKILGKGVANKADAFYLPYLQQGLAVTFVVNTGCAWYSRGVAAKKRESVWFWMVKCFLLGGLALGELVNAVPDPAKAAPTRR